MNLTSLPWSILVYTLNSLTSLSKKVEATYLAVSYPSLQKMKIRLQNFENLSIHTNNPFITIVEWQIRDEIKVLLPEFSLWIWKWLKKAPLLSVEVLGPLVDSTASYKYLHMLKNSGLPKLLLEGLNSLPSPQISGEYTEVKLLQRF